MLQDDDSRSLVMARFNASGWCPDDFGRRVEARKVILEDLIRVEGNLEFERGSVIASNRAKIRDVRRRLEVELYP